MQKYTDSPGEYTMTLMMPGTHRVSMEVFFGALRWTPGGDLNEK